MGKSKGRKEFLDQAGLMDLVSRVVAEKGGGVVVAAAMGVSPPAISQAMRSTETRYDGMRMRILREVGGYDVDTVFQVERTGGK